MRKTVAALNAHKCVGVHEDYETAAFLGQVNFTQKHFEFVGVIGTTSRESVGKSKLFQQRENTALALCRLRREGECSDPQTEERP